MKRKLFGGSVELTYFHASISSVWFTSPLTCVMFMPHVLSTDGTRPHQVPVAPAYYELSMLALFYVVLLSQIVLLLCVRAAMTIQADEPWLSCSWWSHSMPSFSTNPNLGHRLRHEEPPAAGDPCDTRSNTHGGPCRRPERTSHTRTRVKTPRWRGGIVRRGGCRTGRNCPRSRTRCSRARGRFCAVVTTYCGGTTVPLLALGLLGLVGALAAEMHLAALAGKHRRFFA